MAKVSGPLFSLEARGKIADAVVYFPWKGLHVVRQWLKPANPKSGDQGDQRLFLGALGRGTSVVQTAHDFAKEVRTYMDAGLTWPSAITKYMIANVLISAAAWETIATTDYGTHTNKAKFDSEAAALNIQPYDVTYKGTTTAASAGMCLYLIARFAAAWALLGTKGFQRAPYTSLIENWDPGQIDAFVLELSTSA